MQARSFFAGLLVCFSLVVHARENSLTRLSLGDFQREATAHLTQKKFAAAEWGVKIVALPSGAELFETNSQKLLKPASNAKIFTGAMALDVLGPNATIRTSLYAKNRPDRNGILQGDAIVFGRGDPSLAARFRDGNYNDLLGPVVAIFREAGIKEIAGDLVGDETFFTGSRLGSGWTWDDLQYYYGAEASALTFQDNVVDLLLKPGGNPGEPCQLIVKPPTRYLEFVNRTRTITAEGPAAISVARGLAERRVYVTGTLPVKNATYADAVTVPDPARWYVETLRESLAQAGIVVRGQVRTRSWPEAQLDTSAYRELGFIQSAPARDIIGNMLKVSQNLYAQLLLLQVGARAPGKADSTEEAGVRELRAFARRAGVDAGEVLLEEGSGLSRSCLVTPNALTTVLRFMASHSQAELFYNSLPSPGEGTLRSRFRDWREQPGNKIELRAKTGSIRYVNTLSGYLQNNSGKRFVFSIMLNAYNGPTSGRDEVEALVRLLARLQD